MDYTEKMRKDLRIQKPLRTYFDAGSDQFNRNNFDDKIATLARIVSAGYDLERIIREYKNYYSMNGYEHVYKNVAPTLSEFISYLNKGDNFDVEIILGLRNRTEEEVIREFIETLKRKVLP